MTGFQQTHFLSAAASVPAKQHRIPVQPVGLQSGGCEGWAPLTAGWVGLLALCSTSPPA